MIFGINTTRDISKSKFHSPFRNITRGIYAKYHYQSCCYLYEFARFVILFFDWYAEIVKPIREELDVFNPSD